MHIFQRTIEGRIRDSLFKGRTTPAYIFIASFVIIIIVVFLSLRGVGSWKFGTGNSDYSNSQISQAKYQFSASSLTETYTDNQRHFTFRYPAGFTVSSFSDPQDEAADMIIVQQVSPSAAVDSTSSSSSSKSSENTASTVGFQMRVAPIDEDISVLTVERIRQDLPDLTINNPQDVILGDGAAAGKGVAFTSDDPAFGGASREVWFIFNHNLYQIRTYAAYDPLIQAVLGSWMFE